MKKLTKLLSLCATGLSLHAATVHLNQLDYKHMTSGWQTTQANKSIAGNTLKLDGRKFTNGLGTHAPSVAEISLDGKAESFTATIGLDDEVTSGVGSVQFVVIGDKKILYKSAIFKANSPAEKINVNLKGIKKLRFEVNDAGDGIGYDHADWGNAVITYSGVAPKMIPTKKGSAYSKEDTTTFRPEFSTAGFYQVDASVREAVNFNVGWRFLKGDQKGAEKVDFNDKNWEVVNTPHGLELLPLAASGSINYQGVAWYRKHFEIDSALKGKKVFIHFEAIMGKSKIWVNGKLLKEHFGGFLPAHIDVTDYLNYGGKNVIAVWADNSDDPMYPPGKPQRTLDFTYFGGIYRDVWMVTNNKTYVTNPNATDKVAGGGLFVRFEDFSKEQVTAAVKVDIQNDSAKTKNLTVELTVKDKAGKIVGKSQKTLKIPANSSASQEQKALIKNPRLWHVNDPYLHNLFVTLKDQDGKTVDVLRRRIGIRKIEFKGSEGFFLNNEPFKDKLIGGNRHQDYAYIGNALPNTTHWRDAKKLRDAAMRIIRCAHYPQDPSFMDACDELGLFVIVATPGWQFWNKDPLFEKRVVSDIRNMVRRDRNHPSIIMWEPILNETWYPAYFAKNVHETVHQEYPYQGCYTACDGHAKGQEHFDIIYSHPFKNHFWRGHYKNDEKNRKELKIDYSKEKRPIFTREWGDAVDNWSAHNSPSRIAKHWGEQAQLVQAKHYSTPDYIYTSWNSLYDTPAQHFGGTIWHPFDHQRGYHPDTFWGGILDAFRQPKYSYYMFKSQMPTNLNIPNVDSKPFVYIAHEMTPASGKDITVFSNCDEVRLVLYGEVIATRKTKPEGIHMPHAPVVFKDLYNFMDLKQLSRTGKGNLAKIEVEGLIDGKVVTKAVKQPSARRSKIVLKVDSEGAALQADGSDIIPVVAYVCDQYGRIKRLNDEYIRFNVEGAGELVDDGNIEANPQRVSWGEAVALIRAGEKPGIIRVAASVLRPGENQPREASIEFRSVASAQRLHFSELPAKSAGKVATVKEAPKSVKELQHKLDKALQELNALRLKEVERQQQEFEGAK